MWSCGCRQCLSCSSWCKRLRSPKNQRCGRSRNGAARSPLAADSVPLYLGGPCSPWDTPCLLLCAACTTVISCSSPFVTSHVAHCKRYVTARREEATPLARSPHTILFFRQPPLKATRWCEQSFWSSVLPAVILYPRAIVRRIFGSRLVLQYPR